MRFTLACVAALALFSSCKGDLSLLQSIGNEIRSLVTIKGPEAETGPDAAVEQSEREIITDAGVEIDVIAKTGEKSTVNKIAKTYEDFLKAPPTIDGPFPTVKDVRNALINGMKWGSSSLICQIGSGQRVRRIQEWYKYLCF